jgi:hypothetical protein
MKESEVELYFVWAVLSLNGITYKFKSPNQRGVADRIACLPNGDTWFVELKTKGGKLSELQKLYAKNMEKLNQKYTVLWSKEQIDEWTKNCRFVCKK